MTDVCEKKFLKSDYISKVKNFFLAGEIQKRLMGTFLLGTSTFCTTDTDQSRIALFSVGCSFSDKAIL